MSADTTCLQELPVLIAAAEGVDPGCHICLKDAILSSRKWWWN